MNVKMEVKAYALVSDGVWSGTATTLTDAYDVSVTQTLGETKDTFSFKLPNPRGTNKQAVNTQDLIEIHLIVNNEASGDSNLIMYGLVKKVTGDFSSGRVFLRVEGVSFGEITTNALVFYDPSTNTQNVMQYLQSCLNSVALRNENFNVTWNDDNPTVKSDLSAFPTYTSSSDIKKEFDKSFASILDRLLTNEYTEDGDYYWYVSNAKELVIRRRDPSTINYYWTEGVDFKSIKFNINSDDVRNFIVVKCGNDYNNRPITTRYDDPVSRAKFGFRYYLLIDTQIAETEKNKLEGTVNENDNDVLRANVKAVGEERGRVFATSHNKGFMSATCIFAPTTNYSVGDNIALTSSKYAVKDTAGKHTSGLDDYPMRIKEVNYTVDNTMITLEEEVASA